MVGTLGDLTNSIKTRYPKRNVQTFVNHERAFRPFLKKTAPSNAQAVKSGSLKFGMRLASLMNVGQSADGDNVIVPADASDVQATVTPTLFQTAIQFGVVGRDVADGEGGFNGGIVSQNTEGAFNDLGWFIDSTYTGTHGTGRRGRVLGDGGTNIITLALPEVDTLLRVGLPITVRSTDAGSVSGSFDNQRISALTQDGASSTLTYAGTDRTITAGDHIHIATKASQTLTSIAANGLRGLVDDGTFLTTVHALSRDTYPELKANVFGNGGETRNLTEELMMRAVNRIYKRSEKRPTHAYANLGQAEKWTVFTNADRRNNRNSPTGLGNSTMGYDGFEYVYPGGSFKLKLCVNIIPRELYLLDMSSFGLYEAREMDWWDDGAVFNKVPTDGGFKLAVQAIAYSSENIWCDNFASQGVLRDLADPIIGD